MRILQERTSKSTRDEIISIYLTGENSYEELGKYYGVNPAKIRMWVSRYRKSKNVVSLQSESNPAGDMARKKKEEPQSPEIAQLQARIRELELQNLALNTLIDVAEENGIAIRKKSGAKQ